MQKLQPYKSIRVCQSYVWNTICSIFPDTVYIDVVNLNDDNNNNNNNNTQDNVYGAVIMTISHFESSLGSSDECGLSPFATPTITIYYYSASE